MNCDEVKPIINAYVDGELTLEASLLIERHLNGCNDCRGACDSTKALRTAIQSSGLHHRGPAALRESILRSATRSTPNRRHSRARVSFVRQSSWRPVALAASFLIVGLVGWSIGRNSEGSFQGEEIRQQIFSSDVRSLMSPNGGLDVVSSNQHTVKPWFAGKLDFSPQVEDLASSGFPLVGGRRDYVDGRLAAVLVYRRRLHWINLYIWPSNEASPITESTFRGYHMLHWSNDGMTYWAVSDLNSTELSLFAQLIMSER